VLAEDRKLTERQNLTKIQTYILTLKAITFTKLFQKIHLKQQLIIKW